FAIGLYLPIHLSAPIMVGGIIRWCIERKKYTSEQSRKKTIESGILYTSGMIAGEGLIGILLAVFAVINFGDKTLGEIINLPSYGIDLGNIGGLIFFAVLLLSIFKFTVWNKQNKA
ncbi:MAG: OPT/YSL family transporter, partial [Clostridiales bacterium]